MPDVYVRLREGGVEGGVPVPADGRVRLTPVLVSDPDAWVTSAPTVLSVVGGVAAPVGVSPGRWRVDVVSESWARRWELDIVESDVPVNLVTLVPVDPATPVPWLPTEADLVFIRETRERIPELIEAAVAEGDYTGPPGPQGEPGVKGDQGDPGPAPSVSWSGPRLVVGGVSGPDLTGPQGAPGTVPTAQDYMVVGPGRPDAPTTTGMSSAALAALPVGAEYRSTDGASVGAWVWRKRPSGWVVTDGDTGWISIAHFFPDLAGLVLFIRRTTSYVSYRGDIPTTPFIASDAAGKALPAGYRLPSSPRTNVLLNASDAGTGWLWPNHPNGVVVMTGRGHVNSTHAADPSWPTTLTP